MKWDKSVDLLIAGSGGGGMVAALAAVDAGIEPLVVEKQGLIGGSTGMSGGMVWLPNNPLMGAEGIPNSYQDGWPISTTSSAISARRPHLPVATFLTAGYEMIDFLLRKGVRLVRCPGWSDYYPNHKGGNAAGRSVEGIPYDAAALGDWRDKVQPSMEDRAQGTGAESRLAFSERGGVCRRAAWVDRRARCAGCRWRRRGARADAIHEHGACGDHGGRHVDPGRGARVVITSERGQALVRMSPSFSENADRART